VPGEHVEDRARPVAAEIAHPAAGAARATAHDGDVGVALHELLDRRPAAGRVLANQGNRRLDLGHHAHVPQQLVHAAEILADREEQRNPALHVGKDRSFCDTSEETVEIARQA
jgi:hypothetical protein